MVISPKVSVILTSYNSEKYLRESIESALNQTYKDFELILWYDESTDDSWNIISGYVDNRIRVFRNKSNQFVAHFQKAISDVAQGEYVAIHHSDDVWEADKLEKQVAFLDAHPEIGAVFSRVRLIGENSEPFEDDTHFYQKIFDQPNRTRYEWLNYFFYHGNALCHPSVLIRKVCYADCGLYRYGLSQANDLDMWMRLCLKYEIHILPEKLVRFRIRANEMNASGNRPDARIRGTFDRFQILTNYRSIKTAEEFTKIFPNTKEYFSKEDFDIDFALGMAALEPTTNMYAKLFGLQVLFEALNDPDRARKINELYRFSYKDFFILAAKYDVFSTELIPSLSAQLAEKEHENQVLLSQLHTSNIERSLIVRLRRLRQWIAPHGGRRARLLKMVFQSLRVWKNEGLISVYRKVTQKLSLWFSTGNHRTTLATTPYQSQADKLSASLPDLRAISKGQPISSSYDVIFLSRIDWKSSSPGPQQLARRFAQDGHRVFHISTMFVKSAKTKVRSLEEGIFEIQMSGSESMNIHSNLVSGQMIDPILGKFDSLRSEFDIINAICILDMPFWKPISISLPDRFGWRVLDLSQWISSSEEWLDCLEKALQEYSSDTGEKHLESAAQNTWEDRYAQIKQRLPSVFPQASIIVVTYNSVEYTRLCLKSIYEKTIYPNFEVIVVDNASIDGTKEFLRSFEAEHPNIRIIYNEKNEGFARANNLGIGVAHGDYIALLNNDTVVTGVWLSRLIDHLRDQQVGMVGSVTNNVWNEARVEMTFTDSTALEVFATKLAREKSNLLTPIKMLAMYCVVGRRDVFQQIGPLDEQFGIGMFEDDDYSLRMRQAGYKVAVAEDVFIHHFGQSGFKMLGDERYLSLFEENQKKFEAKWNIKWEKYMSGMLAENRQFTADLQRILDLSRDAPGVVIFPPTTGWNINLLERPQQLARAFAGIGFLVFFYTEDKTDDVRGFKQVSSNLHLFNSPWAVFDLVERPVIFTLPHNREYVFQLRQPLMIYEVMDDLDVFPGDKAQLRKNDDILLKEADVVVTTDKLIGHVERIRTNAATYSNVAELDHLAQARESGSTSIVPAHASTRKTEEPIVGYFSAKLSILSRSLPQVKLLLKVYDNFASIQEEKYKVE